MAQMPVIESMSAYSAQDGKEGSHLSDIALIEHLQYMKVAAHTHSPHSRPDTRKIYFLGTTRHSHFSIYAEQTLCEGGDILKGRIDVGSDGYQFAR